MAPEISRVPDRNVAVSAGVQSIAAEIAKAADSQPVESIDRAIQSFAWATVQDAPTDASQWSAFLGETTLPTAAFADSPSKYFINARTTGKDFAGVATWEQVLANLRNPGLRFQDGVTAFLKTGIQEAIASIKVNANSKMEPASMQISLDDLLSAEKMKNPNPAQLQSSLGAMKAMFATLQKMQSAVADLDANRMRFIRA